MSDEISDLSSSDRRRLGELIADCLGPGAESDRERIKQQNPKLATVLESVFIGMDAWNALSPDSLFSRPAAPESLSEPAAWATAAGSAADPEDLRPDDLIVPRLDSRLARGFCIVETVGVGGSAVVYRARLPHEVHGRPDIALKLLRDGVSLEVSKRLRDAQVLKGLDHPNLVRVYWGGESIGHGPFVATEFVEGCNLRQWLQEHGAISPEDAAAIVRTLASALDAAHRKQVVHCDVKPENVFGCRGECPTPADLKIGDFGLARYARPDTCADDGRPGLATGGTIGYMAPEQYWGTYDARSDIYALGGLMLCLLNACKGERVHFLGGSQVAGLRALRESDADGLPVAQRRERVLECFREHGLLSLADGIQSPPLCRIIAKCLAFDPADRYATAADLAEDLTLWLENQPIRHADYAYSRRERLGMLIRRCRERNDVEDHSTLWGLVCLVTGPAAILFSTLITVLVLLGHDSAWTRLWTSWCYIGVWFAMLIPTVFIARLRRPTSQLFGYMLILLAAHIIVRHGLGVQAEQADAIQFLILGVLFGCMGLGSRYWLSFLYLGIVMIALSWPVAIAARKAWYAPYGPALLGITQGLVLIAFGITYLFPALRPRPSGQ